MNILVIGDWHLAYVTSGGLLKKGHNVVLLTNEENLKNIENRNLVVDEPGLDEVFTKGLESKSLKVNDDLSKVIDSFDFVWIAHDTDLDRSAKQIMIQISQLIIAIRDNFGSMLNIVISTQIPLGTSDFLKKNFPDISSKLFIVPENLQLGNGIDSFLKQDRFIIGCDEKIDINKKQIFNLLKELTNNIIIMNHNSAELLKHTLNSYLAMNITFANEIGIIAKFYGASSNDVAKGLKSDKRVGSKAYVLPGNAFHGGTLKRDLNHLNYLSRKKEIELSLLNSIIKSNEKHSNLVIELLNKYENINNVFIAGLSYKINSNVLRDSNFLRDAYLISENRRNVCCFDSDIRLDDSNIINLKKNNVSIINDLKNINLNTNYSCFIINKIKKKEVEEVCQLISNSYKKVSKLLVIDLNKSIMNEIRKFELENIIFETL